MNKGRILWKQTCKSCLAASAPARVWNVTNPTGWNDFVKKVINLLIITIEWESIKNTN